MTLAIETRDLTRKFGSLVAVDSLSLSVESGEVFGLLGPNGAGKTTVIKMLTTLLPPTSGTASVAGADIVRHPLAVRRAIGYVPQLLSADGTLTGRENLLIFAKLYGMRRRERKVEIPAALAFMGLDGFADKLVRQYSGGMIRRLEIAEAMLHRPQVVFLDEPTVGLDPVARQAVWDHIARLRADWGTTILLTTHYMEEADALCGRVVIMHLGRVVASGTPLELKNSIGGGAATLDEVFAHYTGDNLESGGTYRETGRTRRTARRLH
ncbi:MAG: ATP-binding cassette domain-containing protein [Candidatus Bipolaricaulota bacterium]|nr:ATP-binding cassette domain-containing protein [Candidatus Bipolaricaulota bacterium]